MRDLAFCAALAMAWTVGSLAWADDFCTDLKTILASAETDFTEISGPEDDVVPDWHDASISLPSASDCHVDTYSRDVAYFCSWTEEQPADLAATYAAVVQQTDQCLADFQKTTADQVTTWRGSSVGTVTVDSRNVMENAELSALTLTVKR